MTPAQHKLAAFHRWALEATGKDVFVYHREPLERDPAAFKFARKLSDAGLVFLYSRRLDDGRFEKCARKTRPQDHNVLDRVSLGIHVPPSSQALEAV